MKLYYLGEEVELTDEPNVKGLLPKGPGWVNARWPDGKVYTHWRAQLKGEGVSFWEAIMSVDDER